MRFSIFGRLCAAVFVVTCFVGFAAARVSAACGSLPTGHGLASFTVNIPATGTYRLWVHEYALSTNSNGLYAQIDPSCQLMVGHSSAIPAGRFSWVDYQNGNTASTMDIALTAGNHAMSLAGLDEGVGVDKIMLVSDLDCVPTGQGDNCNSAVAIPPPAPQTRVGGSVSTQKPPVLNHHGLSWWLKVLLLSLILAAVVAVVCDVLIWRTKPRGDARHMFDRLRRKVGIASADVSPVPTPQIYPDTPRHHHRIIIFLLVFGFSCLLAGAILHHVLAANTAVSYVLSNATVSNGATVVADNAAIGGKMVRFAAPPVGSTSTPNSLPSSAPAHSQPPTSSSPSPSNSIPAAGSYVQPGTVGYLGGTGSLTVYTSGGATPAGCAWQSYGLRCDDDITLDHVWLKGSLYWNGTGTLTITNSIIDGRQAWYVVYAANSGTTAATHMTIKDSTLRWDVAAAGAYPSGTDVGPIWERTGLTMDIERNDISDLPQGLNPAGGSTIDSNWIHDLVQNGCSGGPCHMDGIFSQGGSNILIQRNYIDAPVTGAVTAGLFFQDTDTTDSGVKVYANFIRGGVYYNLRNETSIGLDVQNNTFGNSNNAWNQAPGTIGVWSGNVHIDGTAVPQP